MIGKTIAHYRVGEKIGAGGMGEVYQATDTKLNREVALKVLPEQFAKDHERMARFKREAQVLASLNHPNIAAIYGLEQEGDTQAIAMELVEGPTLSERIKEGALPLEEALNIAKQIAEALESAHEQGVIHRDLKPANVKVKEDGMVKVLDFGLAKALESSDSEEDIGNSPTLSMAATKAGIILGTAAYMSPEQAAGKKADKRSDVWSFGVVLFEMLTGQRLFTGESVAHVLADVLRGEPDWNALPEGTPPSVMKLLRRCLTRERRNRLRDIGEARIGIDEFLENPVDASVLMSAGSVAEPQPVWKQALPWALFGATAIVALLFALLTVGRSPGTGVLAPTRLRVEVAPEQVLFIGQGSAAVLSPDGRLLAYVAGTGSEQRLYLRPLDQLEAVPLSGTESARNPFFAPDGRWVGFFTNNELKKVSVTGGAPLTLCETQDSRGGTWGPDDIIVFASHVTTGLSRVPAAGGEPVEFTLKDDETRSHRWPQFLPDGRHVVYLSQPQGTNYNEADIAIANLETGVSKVVHRGGTYPRVLPTGHLVFVHEGTLFAAPFNIGRLELTGQPAPVLEEVASSNANGGAQYTFSQSGHLAYFMGQFLNTRISLLWVDKEGNPSPLQQEARAFDGTALSPEGDQLAVDIADGGGNDIWVYDLARGIPTRLTFDPQPEWQPVWSRDGKHIAFSSVRTGHANLYWKRSDGTGDAEPLLSSNQPQYPTSWSPDGKWLAYHQQDPKNNYDIWTLPMDENGPAGDPELFLSTPFDEGDAVFSPDGRWLAYTSTESGQEEIYVRPYPAGPGKWQVSSEGGEFPRWSPNGRELFYRQDDSKMMVVPYRVEGESFRAERARQLFNLRTYLHPFFPSYDVSPDGKRFLMIGLAGGEGEAEEPDSSHVNIIFNWFDEVRRLVPSGKD